MKKAFVLFLCLCLLMTGMVLAEEDLSAATTDAEQGFCVSEPVDAPVPVLDGAPLGEEPCGEDFSIAAPEPAGDGEAADASGGQAVAEEAEEEPEQPIPVAITVKKNTTFSGWLDELYQIEVPGKTIKSCKSSSKKIATVTNAGLVTPVKAGKTTITVTLTNKKALKLTLKVADPKVPAGVQIDGGARRVVAVDDVFQLTALVSPATADPTVTWSSSDKKVAKVDAEGQVTALKPGRAVVKASTSNKKTASFVVNVRKQVCEPYFISHAMGGIDGKDYSNCLEAFEMCYAKGFRVFEVDFHYTSDGRIVLCHDWKRNLSSSFKKGKAPTFIQFMNARIFDKYTPLSLEDFIRLTAEYPDVTMIIDCKSTDAKTVTKLYSTFLSSVQDLGLERILDQIMVEIYNKEMFKAVKKVYPFRSYMYTLYKSFKKAPTNKELKSVCAYCAKNGIDLVGMKIEWWKPGYESILSSYGLNSTLYTTNSASDANKLFSEGVTALFTDFLDPY